MRLILSHLALAALFLGIGVAGSVAQEASPGEALFFRYCATCHGEGARGDGPTAAVISVQPPDLTLLAHENNDVFPVARVVRRIDGRDLLVSHGSPMPIYGAFLEGRNEVAIETEAGVIDVALPVLEIVEWLRGMQRQR